MKVKIDTKEKFHVITPEDQHLTANMTEELTNKLLFYMSQPIKNVILNLKMISILDISVARAMEQLQQQSYDNNCSFVICELQRDVEKFLDEQEILEVLNATPTESEAWDIINMEEIERELI